MAEHFVDFRCADCDTKQKQLVPTFGKIYCEACGRAHKVTGTAKTGFWAHPAKNTDVPLKESVAIIAVVGLVGFFGYQVIHEEPRRPSMDFEKEKRRLMARASSFAQSLPSASQEQVPQGIVLAGQGAKKNWPSWYMASPVAGDSSYTVRSGRVILHEKKKEAAWVELVCTKDGLTQNRRMLWYYYNGQWYLDLKHPPNQGWVEK